LFETGEAHEPADAAGERRLVRRAAVEDVLWTFLNRKEFLINH
jgi:hypothetical protein